MPATARVIALDGAPGPWIPDGFVIVPQVGRGLDERLANAFAAVTGPALLIGMDTPQVSVEHLTSAAEQLHRPGTDAVLGLAPRRRMVGDRVAGAPMRACSPTSR